MLSREHKSRLEVMVNSIAGLKEEKDVNIEGGWSNAKVKKNYR